MNTHHWPEDETTSGVKNIQSASGSVLAERNASLERAARRWRWFYAIHLAVVAALWWKRH